MVRLLRWLLVVQTVFWALIVQVATGTLQSDFVSDQVFHSIGAPGNDLSFAINDSLENDINPAVSLDSGLEFLRWATVSQIEENRAFYQSYVHAVEIGDKVAEIVQRFIRELKGFPVYAISSASLVTGQNLDKKPAWCFHHYMLMDLAKVEVKIYKLLAKAYAHQRQGEHYKGIDSYLTDFETSSLRIIQDQNSSFVWDKDPFFRIATHPILIYRMIRRFVEDLQPILSLTETTDDVELIDELYDLANPDMLVFPSPKDMASAMDNLNRLQEANVLNTFQMGRGIFEDVNTHIPMTALDAMEMGTYYFGKGAFDLAIEWMHLAMELGEESSATKVYPEVPEFMEALMERMVDKHNKLRKRKSKKGHTFFNTSVVLPFVPGSYSRHVFQMQERAYKHRKSTVKGPLMYYNFHRLCGGDNFQSEADKSALHCWYERSSNKYWYINPLKTEMLHREPLVLITYDMIGNSIINRVKGMAESRLRASASQGMEKTIPDLDAIRTSSMTWFDERATDAFTPLSKKFEMLTGLKIFSKLGSDQYAFSTYGAAQHYSLHVDAFPVDQPMAPPGNRMVTILGYFDETLVGGRTAFPVLGFSVKPVKGAVVTWASMTRSGKYLDNRTYHGACPVILGVKRAINKWVHYNDNSETYSCTLNVND